MTETSHAPAGDAGEDWADRFAGPMFLLSLVFLVVLAGLFHRYPRIDPDSDEANFILGALGALWVVFVLEALLRFHFRDRARSPWRPLGKAVACALVPPVRVGCRGLARPDQIWLPTVGWRAVDRRLRKEMDRYFSVPMVLFALMVLPLFVIEYYWADEVHARPALALVVDIGTSVIWLAFTIELVLMVAVSERPVRYCFAHWIDVAIVVLPAFEQLPLLRVLRLGRVLRLDELLRLGRLYRVRALTARGWRAILLLQVVQRLSGRSLEKRRRQLQQLLQAKEEELADLRQEIAELEARMARERPVITESTPVGSSAAVAPVLSNE